MAFSREPARLWKGESDTKIGGFPGGSDSKASAYSVGDPGSIPGLGRSKWQPIPVFLPGKLQSMGSQSQTVN